MKRLLVLTLSPLLLSSLASAEVLECDLPAGSGKLRVSELDQLRAEKITKEGGREIFFGDGTICGRPLDSFSFPADCTIEFSLAYPQKHLRVLCQERAGSVPRRWAATLKISFSPSFESGALSCDSRGGIPSKLALTNCREE